MECQDARWENSDSAGCNFAGSHPLSEWCNRLREGFEGGLSGNPLTCGSVLWLNSWIGGQGAGSHDGMYG